MEGNLKLLNSESLYLPKERDNPNYPEYLEKLLSNYLQVIFKFKGEIGDSLIKNRENIETLCNALIKSVHTYYDGRPSEAYIIFSEGMKSIDNVLWKQKRNFSLGTPEKHYYRGRPSDGQNLYNKADLLHIPFESRHKISTNRYSIPGYPCLYLGNSIYTCWKECGEPDFNNFQVARFDANNYRFLEISLTTKFVSKFYEAVIDNKDATGSADSSVIYYLTAWPLIAACSIRKMKFPAEDRVNFVAEYIIPQMLMEWVKGSQDLDGIKYFSTHGDSAKVDWGEMTNYAIPVKKVGTQGYCAQLVYDLPLTEPVSHNSLLVSDPTYIDRKYSDGNGNGEDAGKYRSFSNIIFFKDDNGKRIWYVDTDFGKMEVHLSQLESKQYK